MTVKVTFHPQVWEEKYGSKNAMPEPGREPVSFTVPDEDVVEDGELPADDSYNSDPLREHENAPDWVQELSGRFYCTTEFV